MSTEREALACPFCGHVGLDFQAGSTFRWLAYSCGGCGMGNETRVQTLGEGTPEQWRAQAERDAVEEWNKRAALAQPAVPQTPCEPLTDEQLRDIFRAVSPGQIPANYTAHWPGLKAFARAVLAAAQEKP